MHDTLNGTECYDKQHMAQDSNIKVSIKDKNVFESPPKQKSCSSSVCCKSCMRSEDSILRRNFSLESPDKETIELNQDEKKGDQMLFNL